ncbi:LytTR family DNA-binding domain-containing protein [Neobacillus sp. DY30]|uniref:LytR/AlgR family response regulator transcription factor n=1 Tax=Neobacillus sp. DY30 TaxID=3047871 RepID=UPI0024C0988D|nr:LytTR family DNA-binding domain-containing protein [Neobacillus sp. DY30]WHY00430.1 LytTR family DNA-binding domain-containing protein [Neobacillus sp. DY30]
MNPIKVLVADDHLASLEMMKYFISDLPDFQLVGQCESGEELVEQAMVKKPDLVLTDIKMPKKNGVKAIRECLSFCPKVKVIFITGFDEFAVEAFEIAAVDYLVKPIERTRLLQALNKAKNLIDLEQGKKESSLPKVNKDVLALRDTHCTLFIPMCEIYFIEKSGKKCLIYTDTEVYETNETIARIGTQLDETFFHSHRSYIINLQKITQIKQQNETFIAYFKDFDKHAGISKLRINELRERISI